MRCFNVMLSIRYVSMVEHLVYSLYTIFFPGAYILQCHQFQNRQSESKNIEIVCSMSEISSETEAKIVIFSF